MRSIIIGFILYLVSPSLHAQELSGSLEFEERVYSFGSIKEEDGKVTHRFYFRNKGTKPVSISNIHSACGCIGKLVDDKAIPPGGKGEILISFDPAYQEGFFSKEIVVLSNNNKEYNRIWVEGNIVPGPRPVENEYPYAFGKDLHLRLKVMAMGYLMPGQSRSMALHYANERDKPIRLSFRVLDPAPGLQLPASIEIGPRGRGEVTVNYRLPLLSKTDEQIRILPLVNGEPVADTIILKVLNDQKPVPVPLRRK